LAGEMRFFILSFRRTEAHKKGQRFRYGFGF
jgi:hypothetical protein